MFDLASVLMSDLDRDERARITEILHEEYARVDGARELTDN